MKYVSTRGQTSEVTFTDTLTRSFASDDGLFVPDHYPRISPETLRSWRGQSYANLAYEIFRLFAPEIDEKVLWRLCADTYQGKNFPYARDSFLSEEITPTNWLHDQVGLLELSNGPSLSFDDVSLQLMARFYEKGIGLTKTPITLLGATTGDMGAAACNAFEHNENVRLVLLSPKGRMTGFQAQQLYSCMAPNVKNLEIEGTFDDCQDIVYAILRNPEWVQKYNLTALNSVVWLRIVATIVYFFYSYLQATSSVNEELVYVCPAGNFGNAFAGWVAKQMGLPIMRLIVATNENDAMDEFIRTGTYRPRPSGETLATSSPSTDIARAANFERFLFDILDRNGPRVQELMYDLQHRGEFTLTREEFNKVRRSVMSSGTSDHADRLEVIETMHLQYDTFVDPHTADALYSGIYLHPVGVKTICLETVSPAKFATIIQQATGCHVEPPVGFEDLFKRPRRADVLPADEAQVLKVLDGFVAS